MVIFLNTGRLYVYQQCLEKVSRSLTINYRSIPIPCVLGIAREHLTYRLVLDNLKNAKLINDKHREQKIIVGTSFLNSTGNPTEPFRKKLPKRIVFFGSYTIASFMDKELSDLTTHTQMSVVLASILHPQMIFFLLCQFLSRAIQITEHLSPISKFEIYHQILILTLSRLKEQIILIRINSHDFHNEIFVICNQDHSKMKQPLLVLYISSVFNFFQVTLRARHRPLWSMGPVLSAYDSLLAFGFI